MTQHHTSIDAHSTARSQEAIAHATRSVDPRWPLSNISDMFIREIEYAHLDLTEAGYEALEVIEERAAKSIDLCALAGLERVRRDISARQGRPVPMGTALELLVALYDSCSQSAS